MSRRNTGENQRLTGSSPVQSCMDDEKVNFSLNGDNYYLPRSKAVELFGEYAVRVLLKGAPQPPEEDKTN